MAALEPLHPRQKNVFVLCFDVSRLSHNIISLANKALRVQETNLVEPKQTATSSNYFGCSTEAMSPCTPFTNRESALTSLLTL